jgi:hypothetical protein
LGIKVSKKTRLFPVHLKRQVRFYPIVAKAGRLQSRGIKGEAVVIYRNPLITKDLESSGFPVG